MDYSKENNKNTTKTRKSKKKKMANKITTLVFRGICITVVVGVFAALSAGIGIYIGIIEQAPSFDQLLNYIQPEIYTTIIFEDRTGLEIDRLVGAENREYVTIDRMPEHLKNAFIAIEDERFYSHNGVDLRAFFRAAYSTLMGDKEGGSTITQQLIKNNVFKINRNSYTTKIQEQYLAINYEKWLTETLGSKEKAKEYVLELYLNTIALHYNLNGVQAAALRYFGKNVEELTLAESAVLAAITQNPSRFSPISRPENNRARQEVILRKMYELGFITDLERQRALAEDVYANIQEIETAKQAKPSFHNYFVDQLVEEVVNDLVERLNYSLTFANHMLYNGGLQIYATIDTDMQAIVEEAYKNDELFPAVDFEISVTYKLSKRNQITGVVTHMERTRSVSSEDEIDDLIFRLQGEMLGPDDVIVDDLIEPVVQPQSAFVVYDYHTGQVKALSGGRGDKLANRVLNRATHSTRQPGSVFKVVASFAPALDLGLITPATVYDDVPHYMEGTGENWPRNWYSNPSYRGLSTVREAIRDSMNVVTVKNFIYLGAENAFDYLLNFGFKTLTSGKTVNGEYRTDVVPSTALGGITDGVTTLDLAAAYGAIANMGEYIEPYFYTKVLDHNGEPLLENSPERKRVLKETTAYLLTDMMKDVITSGTGGRARFSDINMPQAGKTGTTSEDKDLMFAGYTPYYSAAVWLGHDMPKSIKSKEHFHLQIWRYIMEEIHRDLPFRDFETPDGIVTASVCRDSGLLPLDGLCNSDPRGSRIRSEKFVSGTQPVEYCNVHQSFVVDMETSLLATEYCPEESTGVLVGIVRPVPYNGSEAVRDQAYEIPRRVLEGEYCDVHGPHSIIPEFPDEPIMGETQPDDAFEGPIMDEPLSVDMPTISEPDDTQSGPQDGFSHDQ